MSVKPYNSPKSDKPLWRYDFTDYKGKRHRPGGFVSREDAENALSVARLKDQRRRHGISVEDERDRPEITVAKLFERRVAQMKAHGRARVTCANTLERFRAILPANLRVVELTRQHLTEYQDVRLAVVKPVTVHREITDIVSALNSARDLFDELHAWTPPRRPVLRFQHARRERVITDDEITRLLARLRRPHRADPSIDTDGRSLRAETISGYCARLDLADALQIALQTSARSTEVRLLRWSDFNLEWKTMRRRQYKRGGEPLVVPVDATLAEMIRSRRARLRAQGIEGEFIFPSYSDPGRPRSTFNHDPLKRECALLGIPYGRDREDGLVFHDTRHTAVTALLEEGCDLATIQSITGHSNRKMLLHYGHATAKSRQRAAAALRRFAGSEDERTAAGKPSRGRSMSKS